LPLTSQLRVPYSKKLCGDNAAMIGVVSTINSVLQTSLTFDRQPNLKLL
jgi:hypothetical protein